MRPLPQDLEPMDLILLRNVLIYFTADDKRAITARLLQHLRPGGLLLIGHAESARLRLAAARSGAFGIRASMSRSAPPRRRTASCRPGSRSRSKVFIVDDSALVRRY